MLVFLKFVFFLFPPQEWSFTKLTQNYFRLLLNYISKGNGCFNFEVSWTHLVLFLLFFFFTNHLSLNFCLVHLSFSHQEIIFGLSWWFYQYIYRVCPWFQSEIPVGMLRTVDYWHQRATSVMLKTWIGSHSSKLS